MGAGVLLFGSALATVAMPAQAQPTLPLAANKITVTKTPAGKQVTNPLSTAVNLPITATETNAAGTLTFTVTGLPAADGFTISQPAVPGNATVHLTGTFAKPFSGNVTVTATDDLVPAHHGSVTFLWTANNTIAVKATAPKSTWVGVPVSVQASATDSAPAQNGHLKWSAAGLPAGLTINAGTGLISGRPARPEAASTTVTATDAYGSTGSTRIAWNVAVSVIIANPGPETTTAGQWKNINPFKTTDYVPGDKPTYSATGLPAGMGFQGSPMLLYGWPTTAGTYHVVIHENGSLGTIDQMAFKLVVKAAPDKGPTGQIHLALDGKCLQDPGGRTANGTHVQIANCASGATERWTVASDGTIRVNGRCLDIAGTGSASGKQLQLWSCGNANPRQLWAQGTRGELINPASGICVTDPGSSRKNGTVPTMGACHVKSYEQWTLPAQPILTALGGSCADDHYSGGNNGNIVDMFWCNGTQGQAWSFRPDGTIRAGLYGSKCVTVRGRLGAVGTRIVLWTCSSANKGQKWTVVRTGAMSSAISLGGVCLGIPAMTAAKGTQLEGNGTQLITSRCSSTDPRDLWHIG
jgi:hypothetical protein